MLHITKANGEREPFSDEKVRQSIRRAGIPVNLENHVLQQIKKNLYENIPSSEIYNQIIEFLGTSDEPYSMSRYSLKQGLMLLGPTGYPFEDFIGRLLEADGAKVSLRQILRGTCVNHEVDVIAEYNGKRCLIEAKFHNNPGTRSDVHVALYTKARFDDVREQHKLDEAWIVTNTKTTTDANAYAACVGMKVISWSYPTEGSLRDLIERTGLHPVTMLRSLSQGQKTTLLENHIVMCRDILTRPNSLELISLSDADRKKVIDEASYICRTDNQAKNHTWHE